MYQDIESEEWRPIPNYENYLVSSRGRVKGARKGIIMNARLRNGYPRLRIYMNGSTRHDRKHHRQVHFLVATAFIPNPENKPLVNHINGIKHDNRVENLEWVTHQENVDHAVRTGLVSRKLNEDGVRKIFEMKSKGASHLEIAAEVGIAKSYVGVVLAGRCWKHLNLANS